MAKPTLTQAAFLAALSTVACSRSAERLSAEPASAAPAAKAPENAPAPATPAATAAPNASASLAPAPTTSSLANKPTVGSGTELKQGRGVKPKASNEPGGQMTCSANGCSPDMKKNTQ